MPPDSWIAPDDVPALAADATARIDETLSRLTETDRDAFWASVRKCYNTPYNDPKPRALPRVQVPGVQVTSVQAPEAGGADRQAPGSSEASTLGTVLAVALAAIPLPAAFEAHPA